MLELGPLVPRVKEWMTHSPETGDPSSCASGGNFSPSVYESVRDPSLVSAGPGPKSERWAEFYAFAVQVRGNQMVLVQVACAGGLSALGLHVHRMTSCGMLL